MALKHRTVKRFRGPAAMAAFAAGLLKDALRRKKGPLTVALSGGRTPEGLFRALSSLSLPWERVIFFMADERLVPFSSRHSNFGTARRTLFSRIPVPPGNLRPPLTAASYEKLLKRDTGGTGRLDLVFLGLGIDGHTASIFPGSTAQKSRRLVAAVKAPQGIKPKKRLTLTPEALNRARCLVLMAAGPEKKRIFALASQGNKSIPAGRLASPGKTFFLFSNRE